MKNTFHYPCLPAFAATLLALACLAPTSALAEEIRRGLPAVPMPGVTVSGKKEPVTVTTQTRGDVRITTYRLIQHRLTNQDAGRMLEKITTQSPRGSAKYHRRVVRAQPSLVTMTVWDRGAYEPQVYFAHAADDRAHSRR